MGVKRATSQSGIVDPPDGLLAELGRASYDFSKFQDLMKTLWSRVNSPGKDFIHIQKALYVLKYLLCNGSDQVIIDSRVHLAEIRTLTEFKTGHPDRGATIRERAYEVMALLNDESALREARAHIRR